MTMGSPALDLSHKYVALRDAWAWKGLPRGQVFRLIRRDEKDPRLSDIETETEHGLLVLNNVETDCLLDLVMPHV